MSETSAPATDDDTKPCKFCGESIKKVARVCIHCNNYQDWRGKLNIGSTVLALLVALASVLSVGVPAIVAVLTPRNSHIYLSYQGATADSIGVLFSNEGTRPGSVRLSAWVSVPDPVSADIPLLFKDVGSGPAFLVDPGKSRLVQLVYDGKSLLRQPVSGTAVGRLLQSHVCGIYISGEDFLAKDKTQVLGVSCRVLTEFLLNVANQTHAH